MKITDWSPLGRRRKEQFGRLFGDEIDKVIDRRLKDEDWADKEN